MVNNRNYITIGEHTYGTPELTRESEVLFKDIKGKDAYWRREILLKDYRDIWFEFIPHVTLLYEKMTMYDGNGVLISLNKDDSDYIFRIYEQETRRRKYGVWFKNGQKHGSDHYEYLTGDNYFALMWCKMNIIGEGNYPGYRDYQRDYFYMIDGVNRSKSCTGLMVSKAKKTGITNLHWLYYLNKATLFKNQNLGCMNINKDQAAKTFRDYFLLAFNGLPAALKPQIKSKAEAEGRIDFGLAHRNSKANKRTAIQDSDLMLDNSVICVATANKAFDVAVMNDIWFDEAPKYDESFESILTTNQESVTISGYQNGKNWITSYTPDEDKKSFFECREIMKKSLLKTGKDDPNGRTNSGLWFWHIPSYYSWFGSDGMNFDRNGKCNELKAVQEIDEGRARVKDNPRKLQALKRQYAKNANEAWASAGQGSVFDNNRLSEIQQKIELEEEENPFFYKEGFLRWENNLWETGKRNIRKLGQFCNVKFVPLTDEDRRNHVEPEIRMYYDVPEQDRNAALRNGKDEYGNLLPPKRHKYAVGGDPTAYAAQGEVLQKSKNGGGAIRIPDPKEENLTGVVLGKKMSIEYYHRPELPHVAYEVFLKMIIYTGGIAIIEGNQKYCSTKLMEEGMGNYMIVVDTDDNQYKCWRPWMGMIESPEKKYKFIQISTNTSVSNVILEYMVRLYKDYFFPGDGDLDTGQTCKSSRLLAQMQDLDVKDTKKSDLFMGWGYAFIAMDIYIMLLMKDESPYGNKDLFRAAMTALGTMPK